VKNEDMGKSKEPRFYIPSCITTMPNT